MDPASFVERWGAAWDRHDENALAALLTEDAVVHLAGLDAPLRGRDAFAAEAANLLAAVPDLAVTISGWAANDDLVFFSYYATGSADDRPMEMTGIGWYRRAADGRAYEGFDVVDTGVYQPAKRRAARRPAADAPNADRSSGDAVGAGEFVERHEAYWRAPSYAALRPLLADDIVFWWPGRHEPQCGVDAYIAHVLRTDHKTPGLRRTPLAHAVNGDFVFLGVHGTALIADKPQTLRGAVRYRLGSDGRAVEALVVYDTLAS